jgi:hypothetical protein
MLGWTERMIHDFRAVLEELGPWRGMAHSGVLTIVNFINFITENTNRFQEFLLLVVLKILQG